MATFTFEEAAGKQTQEPQRGQVTQPKTFSFEEAAVPQQPQAAQRRPEDVGFFEGAGAAAKRGVTSYGDVASGLGLAALSTTGQEEAAGRKMAEIKAEQSRPQETPGMTIEDFQRIAEKKGWAEALKEAPKYIAEQFLSNAPQMAGPLAVGAGVGAISGPLAPITAPLAGIATYGVQQFGNFLVRQAQEKKDPKELEVAKAALTAAGTAPIGYFADKFTAGIGGKGATTIGKEALDELAKRGVGAAVGAVAKKAGKGAAEGVLAEAPTEVLEQVAERYQAGLDLTSPEAKKEYMEAFGGAAAVGGSTRGVSTGVQAGREVAQARKEFSFEQAKEPAKEPQAPVAEVQPAVPEQPAAPQPVTGQEPWEEILAPKPPVQEAEPIQKETLKPVDMHINKGKIEGVDEIDLDPNELKLSKDVPQFKEDADAQGIVEPLKGKKYDYVGTPPIQVWRRMDGSLEVISGRHRWDLAKRTDAKYIPAQVFDEAKGFNADMAAIMDAELNIRDGKGKITDYVNYFKTTGDKYGLTREDYESRGLLDGKEGKRAYTVAVQGSDDLIQALRSRQVKEDTAYRIADAVPNDPRLQALGLKLVTEKPLEQAINILHAAKTIEPKAQEQGGDLFGFDDSGIKLAEDMGRLALDKQKALSADINTIERAGKNPTVAKKYGINVEDPEGVKAKVKELKEQRAAWDNWASDPTLVDQIRRELAGEPAVEAAPVQDKLFEGAVKKFYDAAVRHRKAAEEHYSKLGGKKQAAFEKIFNGIQDQYEKQGSDSRESYKLTDDAYNEAMARLYAEEFNDQQQRETNGKLSVKRFGPRDYKLYEDGKEIASGSFDDVHLAAWEKRAEYQKSEANKGTEAEQKGLLPSFELKPEEKVTPTEKKAAAEREAKDIADREAEFFKLTPRTPEQGAGNYLQQDMIGAMGLTEAEYKRGIDKKSTEPGEPLVLRDVTMTEHESYNDDANSGVDQEIVDYYNEMENVKNSTAKDDIELTYGKDISKVLDKQAQAVEDYVNLASQGKVTAEEFMKSVREAAAKGDIAPDVLNAIEKIYKMSPAVLEGIRFEVATQGNKRRGKYLEVGHYQPLARMIRLFKDTSGVSTPSTVRHEIAHTMEQMMTPEQKRMVIRAWRDALIQATRAETTDAGHVFFQNVSKFLHNPSIGTYKNVIKSMPNVSYYQYVNPSEYWAVNAEQILKSREAGKTGLKATIEKLHQGLKQSFGMSNFWVGNKVFDQILTGDRFSNRMLINYLRQTKLRNYLGDSAPIATWDSMGTNWLENAKYKYVDKYIDLLRAKQDIERMTGEVAEDVDAYTKETLSHSRISTRIEDFMRDHVAKLADVMRENKISQQQLHEYLWAKQAPDYNRVVGQRNPAMGDNAAGITTTEAENYIRSLGEKRIEQLEKAAKEISYMTQSTRNVLLDGGYEGFETIDAWQKMFPNYVPLYRKDLDYSGGKAGIGRGFQVQGKFSKAAMGSTKEVADISESVIRDHIKAIEKVERARVSGALFGMAVSNPNPSFWMPIDPRAIKDPQSTRNKLEALGVDPNDIDKIMQPPKVGILDPKTSLVKYVTSRTQLQSDNVLATRINGEDVYLIFNNSDPRAARLALAMKNMDLPDVEGALRVSAYITRWFAMVNTQLNPLFGLWNFARDIQGAMLNLSTTKLRGHEKEVFKGSFAEAKVIWNAIRTERSTGEKSTAPGASDWYEFQSEGGTTGYKAQIIKPQKDLKVLESAIDEMNRGAPAKMVYYMGNLISDYNDMLENAVRLSAYKTAVANGMSKQEAANLAKNLTVNFNRKGANSQIMGSLYAFFNASVQGTARMAQTLKGPIGKKIMLGGVTLGAIQGMMMSLAGFEDDEPPEFVKEKNIIIPLAMFGIEGKKYVNIPMPLGFNIFPGVGRLMTEAAIGALKGHDVSKKKFDALSLVFNSFNPLGSTGLSLQTLAPTPVDPFLALGQNKDAFGRPIYKEDRATNPQVGYERTRESTGAGFKLLAELINGATGGTADTKGVWSPTGDEISYLTGQITGGTGRELMKLYSGASDWISGDEIPPYKIPLFGKLYGDAESKANVKNRFYANVTSLAEVERSIKGKTERKESLTEYRQDHPEYQLIHMANRLENEVSQLNKRRTELMKRGATIEQIKHIEDIKERKMRLLNERYERFR